MKTVRLDLSKEEDRCRYFGIPAPRKSERIDATASAGPADLAAECQAERDASDLRREIAAIKAEMAKHHAGSDEFKWWRRRLGETRLRLRELAGATEADQAEAAMSWSAPGEWLDSEGRLTRGKHRGKLAETVARDYPFYLEWVLSETGCCDEDAAIVREHLRRRS